MKLLFFVTGFGYGDSIRIHSLIKEILNKKPETEILIACYDNSYEYFKDKYDTIQIKGYSFPDYGMKFNTLHFLFLNLFLPVRLFLNFLRCRDEIKYFNPDLIISDFEPLALVAAKKLNKKCITIFGFDLKEYKNLPKKNIKLRLQTYFIKKVYNRSNLVVIPSLNSLKKNYSNFRYVNAIVRKYDKKPTLKSLNLDKKPILVMLGGSDFGLNLAKKILNFSKEFKEEFIFFGASKYIPALHYKFKKNFLDYLYVSKGIITLGGNLTLSEAALFKKPVLVYPVKNHVEQKLNVFMIENNVQVGTKNIKEDMAKFLKNLKLLEKKVSKIKIKDTGASEAANIIFKYA